MHYYIIRIIHYSLYKFTYLPYLLTDNTLITEDNCKFTSVFPATSEGADSNKSRLEAASRSSNVATAYHHLPAASDDI